jgi:hypothetical protein
VRDPEARYFGGRDAGSRAAGCGASTRSCLAAKLAAIPAGASPADIGVQSMS